MICKGTQRLSFLKKEPCRYDLSSLEPILQKCEHLKVVLAKKVKRIVIFLK